MNLDLLNIQKKYKRLIFRSALQKAVQNSKHLTIHCINEHYIFIGIEPGFNLCLCKCPNRQIRLYIPWKRVKTA